MLLAHLTPRRLQGSPGAVACRWLFSESSSPNLERLPVRCRTSHCRHAACTSTSLHSIALWSSWRVGRSLPREIAAFDRQIVGAMCAPAPGSSTSGPPTVSLARAKAQKRPPPPRRSFRPRDRRCNFLAAAAFESPIACFGGDANGWTGVARAGHRRQPAAGDDTAMPGSIRGGPPHGRPLATALLASALTGLAIAGNIATKDGTPTCVVWMWSFAHEAYSECVMAHLKKSTDCACGGSVRCRRDTRTPEERRCESRGRQWDGTVHPHP